MIPQGISASFENYKSFAEGLQGFDEFRPLNILIGRNNTGKSALVDLVQFLCEPSDLSGFGHHGQQPTVHMSLPATQLAITQTFPDSTSGGPIPGNHGAFGKLLIGKPIETAVDMGGALSYVSSETIIPPEYSTQLVGRLINPFRALSFRRILADRDIKVEGGPAGKPYLAPDGGGVTNLIQHVLNDVNGHEQLVSVDMLNALNSIFLGDATFTRIGTKRLPFGSDQWEIYLDEAQKGSIPLSASGSGLKTILLVLAHLLVAPKVEGQGVSNYVFGFEELENNLHPGIQRRLFSFMRDIAVTTGAIFFVTTHSSVVIDLFSTDPESQLIHVTHDQTAAIVRSLSEHTQRNSVLDDLDVRASDLLQSNGVIWVEGPSDRIYINRFIGLLSAGRYREGSHYQCMFYGGRLLARVTADPSDSTAINLLNLNRNCALVMDRDTDPINQTKQRMRDEVEKSGGYVLITERKEIECSIPLAALAILHSVDDLGTFDGLESFDTYLDRHEMGFGQRYLSDKVGYAIEVVDVVTLDMLSEGSILRDQIGGLIVEIARWNPGVMLPDEGS
jgi:putative ATP-dependent endonuclease of OLD family